MTGSKRLGHRPPLEGGKPGSIPGTLTNSSYHRDWYHRQSDEWKAAKAARSNARRTRMKEMVDAFKASKGCQCGEVDPVALDFHHTDGDKEINVSDALRRGWGKDRLVQEMQKCQVICSNCHRKLHAGREIIVGTMAPGSEAKKYRATV